MIIVTTSSGRHWQSNTETVLAPVLRRQRGGTWGCAGGIACSLGAGRGTVWPLSLDGCWTSASAGGCSFLQGAGLCGVPLARQPRCPGSGRYVPLVLWPCWVVVLSPAGAPANYGFFYIFLGLFFCFFGSKLTPAGALEKVRLCTGGCCPASPSHRAQSRSGEGTVGRSQTSAPLQSQIPSLELAIWGIEPRATPSSHPAGHQRRAPGGAAENGHSSMPL